MRNSIAGGIAAGVIAVASLLGITAWLSKFAEEIEAEEERWLPVSAANPVH